MTNDPSESDDPLEDHDVPLPLEDSTQQTIAAIDAVDPLNAQNLERHVGDLIVDDCVRFLHRLEQMPLPQRRATAYLAVEAFRQTLSELGLACEGFNLTGRSGS